MRGCGSCFILPALLRIAEPRSGERLCERQQCQMARLLTSTATMLHPAAFLQVLEELGDDDDIRSDGIFKLGKLSPPVLHHVKPHLRVNFYGH